jgi:hypothetical protein
MEFDAVVAQVRSWCDQQVEVVLEPDHSVMSGRLYEIDSAGLDGALFAVDHDERPTTGVAVALFRDAFGGATLVDDVLRVDQGRIEIVVRALLTPQDPPRPASGTEGPSPGH